MSFIISFWLFLRLFLLLSVIASDGKFSLMESASMEGLTMIVNVVTLGILLFLLIVFYEITREFFVFFIVMYALIIAGAIGITESLEVMRILEASVTFDYALWSDFAGLFCGSLTIFFCIFVSFYEMLDLGLY